MSCEVRKWKRLQKCNLASLKHDKPNGNEESTKLWLNVNGELKQSGSPIREMIWSVPEIVSQLSQLYTLCSGDIIFTGTPAGVSSIIPNDTIHAGMNVLGELEFVLQPRRTTTDPVTTATATTLSSWCVNRQCHMWWFEMVAVYMTVPPWHFWQSWPGDVERNILSDRH